MTMHAWPEVFGYVAASLLLLTFFMRKMVPLRAVAIGSSVAWLVYGWADHIYPVLCLHLILLPLNGTRLCQALHADVPNGPGSPQVHTDAGLAEPHAREPALGDARSARLGAD